MVPTFRAVFFKLKFKAKKKTLTHFLINYNFEKAKIMSSLTLKVVKTHPHSIESLDSRVHFLEALKLKAHQIVGFHAIKRYLIFYLGCVWRWC